MPGFTVTRDERVWATDHPYLTCLGLAHPSGEKVERQVEKVYSIGEPGVHLIAGQTYGEVTCTKDPNHDTGWVLYNGMFLPKWLLPKLNEMADETSKAHTRCHQLERKVEDLTILVGLLLRGDTGARAGATLKRVQEGGRVDAAKKVALGFIKKRREEIKERARQDAEDARWEG